ncbi:GntR family transcriptional regulator [Kocuria sp. NPDC057446]|uniref:GntR family transcriptional regulator n=1 Tax=Kocuria sp. NPDC057446 TaxID=3346137 RepID=UPI0036BB1963
MNTVENEFLTAAVALAGPAPQGEAIPWAVDVLRQGVVAGRLPPGTRLSEARVSEALGVSRNTLREAFTILVGENLLVRVPNRGVSVARPGADDVREIHRVRLALETSALRWSEPAPQPGLHAAVADGRAARRRGDAPGMADANQRFHRGVVELAGSARQDELMARTLAELRLVFYSMRQDPSFHEPYIERNARILELFEQGRREESAVQMHDYLEASRRQLLEVLEGPGPGPVRAPGTASRARP